MGEKEAGGWGAATNHRTSMAMAVRWGDHTDVSQGRAWRGRLESEKRRNAPGEARWIGICGCPCGRGKETHEAGQEGRWERQVDRRRDNRSAGERRVETWGPVEREARTWGNRYAVLSETTADVRHVHSGECSMVEQRLERVQGLRRAVGEVERVVKDHMFALLVTWFRTCYVPRMGGRQYRNILLYMCDRDSCEHPRSCLICGLKFPSLGYTCRPL